MENTFQNFEFSVWFLLETYLNISSDKAIELANKNYGLIKYAFENGYTSDIAASAIIH